MKTILVFDKDRGRHTTLKIGNDEDGSVSIPHVNVKVEVTAVDEMNPAFLISFPGQFIRQTEVRDHLLMILRKLANI